MFGFLRPPCHTKSYRQIYAAICSHQRQQYGVVASVLISYEAVFLYQLAVDAGVVDPPAVDTPTCCRLRNDWANHWQLDRELADFCVAFAVVLAKTKIEDDVRDTGYLHSHLANYILKKSFRKSAQYFDRFQPELLSRLANLIEQHLRLEQTGWTGAVSDYSRPTGEAFGLVFERFGKLCEQRSQVAIAEEFRTIGLNIGRGILISDCLLDARKDQKSGAFNPIKTRSDAELAKPSSLTQFADAGWLCDKVSIREPSGSCQILRHAFDRIARFDPAIPEVRPHVRAIRRFAQLRFGDCDCLGECCCEGCCQIGQGGCEACGAAGGQAGEAAGGCSNGCNGPACGPQNNPCQSCFCDVCLCPFDSCVDCGESRKARRQQQANRDFKKNANGMPAGRDPLIGAEGVASVRLNPSGYVLINGQSHPAKSDGEWIDQHDPVIVVGSSNFGLVVRRKG